MNCLLTLGSVTQAALGVRALSLAQPAAETMAALRALHPFVTPLLAPAQIAASLHASLEAIQDVQRQLPKAPATVPSGWTDEHVKVATVTPDSAISAALELINTIFAGALPHLPELLDCYLIGLE